MGLIQELHAFRLTLVLILTPIILLPLLIFPDKELKTQMACAYTILLMAVYWVTEVVPLAVTALLPLVFYPLLGVLAAKKCSVQYLKDVNVLFLGGLTVAVAVEHWNLHKRIALKVLTWVGAKPRWLMFGFMVTTAFLSMWISNVATTAMMIPIAQAVLKELIDDPQQEDVSTDSGRSSPHDEEKRKSRDFVVGGGYSSVDQYGNPHPPHDVDPASGVVCPAQPNALISEMGNIGQAQALGARLAAQSQGAGDGFGDPSNVRYSHVSQSDEDQYMDDSEDSKVKIVISPAKEAALDHGFAGSYNDTKSLQVGVPHDAPDSSTAALITNSSESKFGNFNEKIEREKRNRGMSKALTICVCYAANIGGTATLTGTGPNLILAGQLRSTYENAPEVDFGSWSFFAFPGMCVYLVIAWCWLCYYFLNIGLKDLFCSCCGRGGRSGGRADDAVTKREQRMTDVIRRQYNALGPMSFAEKAVLFFFTLLALLWVSRDPGFIPGWGSLLFEKGMVSDATVAMTICFILFVFPSRRPNFLCFRAPGDSSESGPVPPLLSWNVVQSKMAWNVILLLGGSFAMAAGSKESGLSQWIGEKMSPLVSVHPLVANLCCLFVICALTQCTSNTATATVFLPILAELGEVLHVHPLYLMLPATLITSYAFMLPVSTPPNAIAYSYGHLKMMDMVKAGSFLNVLGFVVAIISVYLFGPIALDTNTPCPDWLQSDYCMALRDNVTALPPVVNFTGTASAYDQCIANGLLSCQAQFNATTLSNLTAT